MDALERSDLPEGQQSKPERAASTFKESAENLNAVEARVRAQVAEELRAVVEKAIKNWALMYPIPANGLAWGNDRGMERLAGNWASSATDMVFEALNKHASKASESVPGRSDRERIAAIETDGDAS